MNNALFIVLAVLLSGGALLAVAFPILSKSRHAGPSLVSSEESLDELLARRDAAMQALRELNFDRRVGKITEEDFVIFEANLKENAADTLRALDKWEAAADADLQIERAIAARRRPTARDSRPCPHCGQPSDRNDRFCVACGRELNAATNGSGSADASAAMRCPRCNTPALPGDRFCAACGSALPETVAVA